MENPALNTHFKNGDNIHFDYSAHLSDATPNQSQTSALNKKKKKKKKKKAKATTTQPQFSLSSASLNDPDAEYPQSRVIKVASNGDVIVESLDDDYTNEAHDDAYPHEVEQPQDLQLFHFNNEEEAKFWDSLSESQRRELFQIDSNMIFERFQQQRHHRGHASAVPNEAYSQSSASCSCPYCGRNNRLIEHELETSYRWYLEEILEFVQNLSSPEQLTLRALKDAVSGNEQEEPQCSEYSHEFSEHSHLARLGTNSTTEPEESGSGNHQCSSRSTENKTKQKEGEDVISHASSSLNEIPKEDMPSYTEFLRRMIAVTPQGSNPTHSAEMMKELVERDLSKGLDVQAEAKKSVQYMVGWLSLFKGENATANRLLNMFLEWNHGGGKDLGDFSEILSCFADLILQNDGNYFVDLIDSLVNEQSKSQQVDEVESDSEDPENEHYALQAPLAYNEVETYAYATTEYVRSDPSGNSESSLDNNLTGPVLNFGRDTSKASDVRTSHRITQIQNSGSVESINRDPYINEYEADVNFCGHGHDYDHPYDEHNHTSDGLEHQHDHEQEHDDDSLEQDTHHYEYDRDDDSDFELEQSQTARVDEARGFFMIQILHVIKQRFKETYEKRISEVRTQKFIEELEAEENAKKEKELKKLKQKEKQKEKKRIQQLAKEEEKKKKEAEDLQKAEEARRKQELLRVEQMKRKEELRIKKEEEKLKKIEALRKKELEQQKAEEMRLQRVKETSEAIKLTRAKQQSRSSPKPTEGKVCKNSANSQTHGTTSSSEPRSTAAPAAVALERTANIDLKAPKRDIAETPSDFSALPEPPSGSGQVGLTAGTGNLIPEESPLFPMEAAPPVHNHLLDQLYHARPRSISTASGSANANSQAFANGNSLVGSMYSPTKQTPLIAQREPGAYGWSNLNVTGASPSRVLNPTLFSPFAGQSNVTGEWNNQADPFGGRSVAGQTSMASNSLWAPSYGTRSNSIWNSTGSTNGAMWGNTSNTSMNSLNTSLTPSLNPGLNTTLVRPDGSGEVIYAAAYEAFQTLQNSNQVVFGMVPAIQLFQSAKALMRNSNIGMAEFLSSLRAGGQGPFDFVYDDFGSVTHIKKVDTAMPPLMQQGQLPLQQPVQQPLQQLGQTLLQQSIQQPLQQSRQQPHQPLQQPFQQSLQLPTNYQTGDNEAYELNLSGSVQGVLNHLGLDQSKDGIW